MTDFTVVRAPARPIHWNEPIPPGVSVHPSADATAVPGAKNKLVTMSTAAGH